jgi:hypothetical protein
LTESRKNATADGRRSKNENEMEIKLKKLFLCSPSGLLKGAVFLFIIMLLLLLAFIPLSFVNDLRTHYMLRGNV